MTHEQARALKRQRICGHGFMYAGQGPCPLRKCSFTHLKYSDLHKLDLTKRSESPCTVHLNFECYREYRNYAHDDNCAVMVKVGDNEPVSYTMETTIDQLLELGQHPRTFYVDDRDEAYYRLVEQRAHSDPGVFSLHSVPVQRGQLRWLLRDYRSPDSPVHYSRVTVHIMPYAGSQRPFCVTVGSGTMALTDRLTATFPLPASVVSRNPAPQVMHEVVESMLRLMQRERVPVLVHV